MEWSIPMKNRAITAMHSYFLECGECKRKYTFEEVFENDLLEYDLLEQLQSRGESPPQYWSGEDWDGEDEE